MSENLPWRMVFLIWLAALPFVGAAGFVAYQKYPVPFQQAAKFGLKEYTQGKKAYQAYKVKKAKEAAEAAKKASEDDDQANSGF